MSRGGIKGEVDEFWQIALAADESQLPTTHDEDDSALSSSLVHEDQNDSNGVAELDDDTDLDPIVTTAALSYRLPLLAEAFPNGVTLRLSGLSTGIASPVGAQAWYGSALLSAVLLDPRSDDVRNALANTHAALELGSGAVGLSGLALACAVAQHNHLERGVRGPSAPSRIVLTDHDDQVLTQLRSNASRATSQILHEYPGVRFPDVSVDSLDWGGAAALLGDGSDSRLPSDIGLVVGSELVYTAQNAKACAEMVLALLRLNPRALVVIVQVTDREGWGTVFLPLLDESKEVKVRMEPIDPAWHDAASSMIPLGGTTDRFDFGLCYISRAT